MLVLLVPALLQALPAVGGGRGLFRVQSALTEETGIRLSGFGVGRHPMFHPETAIPATFVSGWVADGVGALEVTPYSSRYAGFELFGSWGAIAQWPIDTVDDRGWPRGFHDARAGLKLSFPYLKVFKVGGLATYTFRPRDFRDPGVPHQKGWLDPDCVTPPFVVNDTTYGTGLGWAGLVNIQLQDLALAAPNLLLNFGQAADRRQYGFGVEWVASSFDLFAEVRSLCDPGVTSPMDTTNDARLTAGGRFKFGYAFALSLAYTFGLARTSPNEAVLGFEWTTPFLHKPPARFGTIAGRVIDARNGAALRAEVSLPDLPKLVPVIPESTPGVFKFKKVPVGDVIVEARMDGYVTQAMPLAVTENQTASYEFRMQPTRTYGTIAGVVTAAGSNQPLQATIEFPGTQIGSVVSDAAGSFRVDNVETGIYTVTATADKYLKGTLTVTVEDGKSAPAAFALTLATSVTTMTGKVSDKKTGDPLTASVSFPGTSIAPGTSDPATGVYRTELPIGAYAVVVEAEGYVKQTAAVVLEKDKPLIKDFELVKVGMVLTLKNIYFDFDKATIKLPQSAEALQGAYQILSANPTIKVEIQGHTDSKGSDEYNLRLSDRRAAAVVDHLVKTLGVESARLTSKGYGESKPVATNDTDEGRALNRRVEFVITGETEQK
jgi:outer membrane protein OmpA-like peptidoglycan-associated protein